MYLITMFNRAKFGGSVHVLRAYFLLSLHKSDVANKEIRDNGGYDFTFGNRTTSLKLLLSCSIPAYPSLNPPADEPNAECENM